MRSKKISERSWSDLGTLMRTCKTHIRFAAASVSTAMVSCAGGKRKFCNSDVFLWMLKKERARGAGRKDQERVKERTRQINEREEEIMGGKNGI